MATTPPPIQIASHRPYTLLRELEINHTNFPARNEARPTTSRAGIISIYRQSHRPPPTGNITVDHFYHAYMRLMVPGAPGGEIKYIQIENDVCLQTGGVFRFRPNELHLVLEKIPAFEWNHAILRRRRREDGLSRNIVAATNQNIMSGVYIIDENDKEYAVHLDLGNNTGRNNNNKTNNNSPVATTNRGGNNPSEPDDDDFDISNVVVVADLFGDFVYSNFALRTPIGLSPQQTWLNKPLFEYTSLAKLSYSVGDHVMHDDRLCVVTTNDSGTATSGGANGNQHQDKYVMKLIHAPAQLTALATEVAVYRAIWESGPAVARNIDLSVPATSNPGCSCYPSPFDPALSPLRVPRFIGHVVDGGGVVGILLDYIHGPVTRPAETTGRSRQERQDNRGRPMVYNFTDFPSFTPLHVQTNTLVPFGTFLGQEGENGLGIGGAFQRDHPGDWHRTDFELTFEAMNEFTARSQYIHGNPTAGHFMIRKCRAAECNDKKMVFAVGFGRAVFVGNLTIPVQRTRFYRDLGRLFDVESWTRRLVEDEE